jgi:hypothetical protein
VTVATLDQVAARAREVHPGRVLLTAVAAVLFGLGWLAARAVTLAVAVALWSAAAVSLGWREARPRRAAEPGGPPPRVRLVA